MCRKASFGIYKIGRIRKYLDRTSTERLVHAFVSSHLDCNKSLLYGLPHNLLSSLQRVQNSAARLITGTKRREHISPILRDLHWLTVKDRIHFKILLLTYKAVHGHAPAYIRNLISFTTLKSLRSASQLALKPEPRSKTSSYSDRGPLQWLHPNSGTISLTTSALLHQLVNSKHNSKLPCLINCIFYHVVA